MGKNNLKKLLEAYFDVEKIKLIPRGYDLIGHIAILEIPDQLKKKKKLIAKAILQTHKNIETVLEKASERKGKFRVRKYKFLAGKRKFETVHKEYGCQFKLNPTKVYFSPRELTERQKIAEQVKPNEFVMVMFAGIGVYAIQIAKKQSQVEKVVAVEVNPTAVKYMKENVRINKLGDKIIPVLGDVREKCKSWYGKCDRIVMPLPLGSDGYLDVAVKCLKKKGGIIHFYNWGDEEDPFFNALNLLQENFKIFKKKFKVLNERKVLPYSPKKWKVCIDVLVK
jgi:tRNA (guanine37-N1)-methyltransferase